MPVITCSVFQTTKVSDSIIHWHIDIHGIEETTEISYLEEIQPFNKRGLVLTARLDRDESETAALYPQFPPMERITAILNKLNGQGYRIVGCTNINNSEMRQFILWTLEK